GGVMALSSRARTTGPGHEETRPVRTVHTPRPRRARPARAPGSAHRTGAHRWQVFGLAGVHRTSRCSYWPSLPRWPPSARDGGRSRSPLRGSPGLAPGSLLPPLRLAGGWEPSAGITLHVVV